MEIKGIPIEAAYTDIYTILGRNFFYKSHRRHLNRFDVLIPVICVNIDNRQKYVAGENLNYKAAENYHEQLSDISSDSEEGVSINSSANDSFMTDESFKNLYF